MSTSVPTDTFVHVSLFAYELNLSIAQLPLIALNMRSFCMVNIHITVCVLIYSTHTYTHTLVMCTHGTLYLDMEIVHKQNEPMTQNSLSQETLSTSIYINISRVLP